jgi:AcrR family transcriptional regulator
MGAARREEIAEVALRLLERDGPDALTMRRLADELGIQAPSLYKHYADKAELEAAMTDVGLDRLTTALRGKRGYEALASAYRSWALGHPHLYRLAMERSEVRDGDVEKRAAAPWLAVAGDPDLARAVWAFAHGMVQLELAGRFPAGADLDAAWWEGTEAFRAWAE